MKPEEFDTKITEALQSSGDQGKLSTIFAELKQAFASVVAENTTFQDTTTKLTSDNENLRAANMKLFLQIGQPSQNTQHQETTTETQTESLSYDKLFDDNGNLK